MKKIQIGRNSKADYFIDDESVSRNHAEIRVTHHSVVLVDLKSRNGTFVLKDKALIPIDTVTVTSEDTLYFGDSGPHKVDDIIQMGPDATAFVRKDGELIDTQTMEKRVRCAKCGAVVRAEAEFCPDCGSTM